MCHGQQSQTKRIHLHITPAISLSFELLSDLFKLQPQREYMLWKEHLEEQSRHQMQYEVGGGSAGFLSVIDPGQPEVTRLGGGHYSACRPA